MKFQWNILTIVLLTTVVGVWTGYIQMVNRTSHFWQEAERLSSLSELLFIRDRSQYAVKKDFTNHWRTQRWQLYVPQGNTYLLHLATRGVSDLRLKGSSDPADHQEVALRSGLHEIHIAVESATDDSWGVSVSVDDRIVMHSIEDNNWYKGSWERKTLGRRETFQQSADSPLSILRMKFHTSAPNDTGGGILLWVDKE